MAYSKYHLVPALKIKRLSGQSLTDLLSPTELILGNSSWVTMQVGGEPPEAFVMVGGLICGYHKWTVVLDAS